MLSIGVVFFFVVTVSIDGVDRQGTAFHRWDHVDIDLVPAARVEARSVPESVKRGYCALFARSLHPGLYLTVSEFLVGGHRARFKVGLGNADHGKHRDCKLHLFNQVLLKLL